MTYYEDFSPYGQGIPYMQPVMAQTPDPPQCNTALFSYPQNYQNALAQIRTALGGETEDRMFYTWLIEHAPSEADRQIISGIRDNEICHFGYFRQLYRELTGSAAPAVPQERFTPPATYCEGLGRALQGEQGAVQRYRQILFAMQTRDHFNMLTEIITDEIRHGILYSYLYSKNGCRG